MSVRTPTYAPLRFTVWGPPQGKPRMTRQDKWTKARDRVMRYREWEDRCQEAAGLTKKVTILKPIALEVMAYVQMPDSWEDGRRHLMRGEPCGSTPDFDNIEKAVADSLFKNDNMIYRSRFEKYWDDGKGPRVEVLTYIPGEHNYL